MKKDTLKKLEEIVRERFENIKSLETKGNDSEDFHEISIWGLKEILEKAYELGKEEAK